MAIECLAYGQLSVSNERNKQGMIIASGGVRALIIIATHSLFFMVMTLLIFSQEKQGDIA